MSRGRDERFGAFDLVGDPVVGVDDNERLVVWNTAAAQVFGVAPEAALGRPIGELIAWIEPSRPENDIRAAIQEHGLWRGEIRAQLPDRRQLWFDVTFSRLEAAELSGRLAVLRDCDRARGVREELERWEERFRALIEQSPLATVVFNPDGRPLYVNPAQLKLTRLQPEEQEGFMAAYNVLQDKQVEAAGIMPLIKRGFAGEPVEVPAIRYVPRELEGAPDRPAIWLKSRVFPVTGHNGQVRAVVVSFEDVTEQIRGEEERKRLDAQVQQTQKLESLGLLAGGVAHDFNNLLVGILGNASLALLDTPAESPVHTCLLDIESGAHRAAELARQLLAYSGQGQFDVSLIGLNDLVEEMSSLLELSVKKRARLELRLGGDLDTIAGDATEIRQILMNLVTNASEAVAEDDGGTVTVTTGVRSCDAGYLADTQLADNLPPGDYVFMEVADDGCGFAPKEIDRIFDPFYTTKFTGRGLGLAAVLGIVRSHKGAIKVRSQPAEGSSFRVLFPAVEGLAEPSVADESSSPWRAEGTVLLVDDEPAVRAVGSKSLKRLGFEVILASDGREALDLFDRHGEHIVLVVLDMTMPGMSGVAVLERLRQMQPALPVLITSGYTESEVSQQLANNDRAGFLRKPFTFASLCESVRHALESRRVTA